MKHEFAVRIEKMVEVARTEAAAPGRRLTLKALLGDVNGRFGECIGGQGLARPLHLSEGQDWLQRLRGRKRWNSKEPIFEGAELDDMDSLLLDFMAYQDEMPVKGMDVHVAETILEQHFGTGDVFRRPDAMIDAIVSHSNGPFYLRAAGDGYTAILLLRAFLRIAMSKKFKRFGNDAIQIDAAILGVFAWTLYQYHGGKYTHVLWGLVYRNIHEAFFGKYVHILKEYQTKDRAIVKDMYAFAVSNPTTNITSYGSGPLLVSAIYNKLGRFARAEGADPFQEDGNHLDGKSGIGCFDEAIRIAEKTAKICISGFEEIGLNNIAKANFLLDHKFIDQASYALARAEEALSMGQFNYVRANYLEAEGRLYRISSGEHYNDDFRKSQDKRREAVALYEQMGCREDATKVRSMIA
jgi:hypothetical protein